MRSAAPGETRVLSVEPNELLFRRFRLQVVSGPDRGLSRASDACDLGVGTAAGNQLVLTDSAVSRHHCAITATADGFLLEDLGSTNGTLVNGLRAKTVFLAPASLIAMGETTLHFDSDEEHIREPLSKTAAFGGALGRSPAMRRIFALLPRIADADSTVLIEGETGTGKGLLADAIHESSPRADGPFVVLDCGAIPPTLIESELFGHEKGSFTGAHTSRTGAFEAANGGTLFLDELGELPLEMQPKLLRVLEHRAVKRIGGNREIHVDVRVIAATNRDLRQEVNRETFRSDLYYRLNTIRLRIPPLRERREDIPLLVEHFYHQYASDEEDPPADMVARLYRQTWPGNVRELRSAVERSVLMGDLAAWNEMSPATADTPGGEAAPVVHDGFDPGLSFRSAKERAIARWERWYVKELAERHGGNLSRASRAARMDRNHLRELLRKHDVQP